MNPHKLIGTGCYFDGGTPINIVLYLDNGHDLIHSVSVNDKVNESEVVTFAKNFANK